MKQSIKPMVALVTFSIGVAVSQTDLYAVVLVSPVAVFFLFHLLLLGGMVHQLRMRENNRRQVIGKGVLAEVVWLIPSLIVLIISLGYMMSFSRAETGINSQPLALMVIGATTVSYGLVGWVLFRWVRNPRNEELGIWERERGRNH